MFPTFPKVTGCRLNLYFITFSSIFHGIKINPSVSLVKSMFNQNNMKSSNRVLRRGLHTDINLTLLSHIIRILESNLSQEKHRHDEKITSEGHTRRNSSAPREVSTWNEPFAVNVCTVKLIVSVLVTKLGLVIQVWPFIQQKPFCLIN